MALIDFMVYFGTRFGLFWSLLDTTSYLDKVFFQFGLFWTLLHSFYTKLVYFGHFFTLFIPNWCILDTSSLFLYQIDVFWTLLHSFFTIWTLFLSFWALFYVFLWRTTCDWELAQRFTFFLLLDFLVFFRVFFGLLTPSYQ